jgi:hypothetical protein
MNSESLRGKESNKLLCNWESLRGRESASLLTKDVIRLIALKLNPRNLYPFILSFPFLNRDSYFWKLYYINLPGAHSYNPLKLSYKELVKRFYLYRKDCAINVEMKKPYHLS